MSQLEIYKSYVEKLVKCLPMDDVHFIKKLSERLLLSGDIENKIKQSSTQSDKASYFLSHVIKPALDIDDVSGFKQLLSIMHTCGYDHVEKLSCQIENDMNEHLKPGILMFYSYAHTLCMSVGCCLIITCFINMTLIATSLSTIVYFIL